MDYFCTYFDRNYLTRGLALYHSLSRHCQRPFILWVLCFDDETHDLLSHLNLSNVRLIAHQEFEAGDAELARAKANRSRIEYYWTCTPSLPLYVLRHNPQVDVITYLDADLYFYSDPYPIYDELGNGSILIVGHRYAPEHAHFAATSGVYNVGLLAFRRDERGMACLHWWRERCLEWCCARVEDGKFGDQKYLDDWPERFQGVVVLCHKGAGLAPWNLSQYKFKFDASGITVDGQPLIFYHFHGFKFVSRRIVEPAGYRYRISLAQALKLYLPYAYALQEVEGKVMHWMPNSPAGTQWPVHDLVRGLYTQHWLLVRPRGLTAIFWRVGDWSRNTGDKVEAGLKAYSAGDSLAARRSLLDAVLHNPLILRNLSVLSILLESWIGSARMGRYRQWWRCIKGKLSREGNPQSVIRGQ